MKRLLSTLAVGCAAPDLEPPRTMGVTCWDAHPPTASNCDDGACADPEAQVWADGYALRLSEAWGVGLDEVDAHLDVNGVELDAWNGVQLGVILRMGWVSIAATMFFDDGDPAQPAEVGPLLDWPPADLPLVEPRDWAEITAFLDGCEREHGVRLVRDWCDWDIEATGPLDDREGVLSFVHYAEEIDGQYAIAATIFPLGGGTDRCEPAKVVFVD